MSERGDRDGEHLVPEPDDQTDDDAWTDEIRRLRRARGRRLKELFEAFNRDDEEGPSE
jgi:hypothetical protein